MNTYFINATILDGTGAKPYCGNVACIGGKLALNAPKPDGAVVIDAAGLWLCPGFIDAHSHGDLLLSSEFSALAKVSQGITTQAAGQCGFSLWPDNPVEAICPYPTYPPKQVMGSFESFLRYAEALPRRLNTFFFVGHGSLRHFVMGDDRGAPTRAQLERMAAMLKEAIRGGALGLSTGLVYAPGCFAGEDEIAALLKAVHEADGLYATHVRNEGVFLEAADEEALRCAKAADVPLFISHFKAGAKKSWGKPARLLERFDREIAQGMRITLDHYPYLAGMTSLNVSIPPRFRTAKLAEYLRDPAVVAEIRAEISVQGDYDNYILNSGGFEGVQVSACPLFHDAEGLRVSEYARRTGQTPFDAYIDILRRNEGLGLGIYFHMCEEDLLTIAQWPHAVLGTDGLLSKPGENGHPRAFGAFPHAIDLYVKQKRLFTPEAFMRRITSLPAERLKLSGKGRIAEGYDADLVLMDYASLKDGASYTDSNRTTAGILGVWTGGARVYENGSLLL